MSSNKTKYFLISSRLGFRTWNENDLPLALTLWGDERVTRYINSGNSLTNDHIRDRLSSEIEIEKSYGFQYWPIFLLKENEFAGCCGLRPYDDSKGILEIGTHIVHKFRNECCCSWIVLFFTKTQRYISALYL